VGAGASRVRFDFTFFSPERARGRVKTRSFGPATLFIDEYSTHATNLTLSSCITSRMRSRIIYTASIVNSI
jgi:hypothetical protein